MLDADLDADAERPISFGEAVTILPKDYRPSYSTWWRWWRKGIRGVKLQTLLIGGRRFTTAAAMQRFIAELSTRDADRFPPHCAPVRRDHDRRAVEVELHKKGIL